MLSGDEAYMAALGGLLIAVSSSLHYMLFGRITGMSGMLFNVIGFKFGPLFPLRVCFIVSLITIVDFFNVFSGKVLNGQQVLLSRTSINFIYLIIGGLLIGMGVRWGGGCTSGHGVCGIPRLSKRSFVAVPVFMLFGMLAASLLSLADESTVSVDFYQDDQTKYMYLPRAILSIYQLGVIIFICYNLCTRMPLIAKIAPFFYVAFGAIFGLGLLISGMCNPNKIKAFLTLNSDWDPSLAIVMAVAVAVNFVTFQLTMKKNRPLFGVELDLPDQGIDKDIVIGPILFGLGWGITGLCPGPALANITVLPEALLLVLLIFLGQISYDYLNKKKII